MREVRQHCGEINFATNTSGNPTSGMTNELLLRYGNDAINLLQSLIIQQYTDAFLDTEEIDVDGSDSYTPTSDILYGNKIKQVEYSSTGQSTDYYVLDPMPLRARSEHTSAAPDGYVLRNGSILLSPKATEGTLRVTFYAATPKVDIRRGQITSKTLTTVTLDADSDLDLTGEIGRSDYFCIVSNLGVQKDVGRAIVSYDSTTRVITIASQTLVGDTADYITLGKNSSSHLQMGEQCERYVQHYMQHRLFVSKSSVKAAAEEAMMRQHLKDILESYAVGSHDISHVPVMDYDLFD